MHASCTNLALEGISFALIPPQFINICLSLQTTPNKWIVGTMMLLNFDEISF
jgi:hypothetical protein